ncbi:enolase 4 isoform X2 [Balaenoptera ricei]|uniref:enolase 4 isoform X2 n=1 Tax=Balaenoptera ricei TaxID=2746895 RepID=UPI0028BE8C2E|nr:enolase 4 isoform X2 [Balaenoptera ricei]
MGEEGGGRSCGTTRDLQKLKQQAMEYYRENDVPRRLEELLNSTFYLQPADVYGHLANCFSKLAKPPTICKVVGKNVLDGLGLPTLQVEIFCTVQNFPKNICSVVISTHFEVHENALPELVEAEELERSDAVSTAVQWVNETITEELQGLAPSNQAEVDQVLRTFFESKVQEDKERKELEKSLEDSTVPTPSPLTPPLPPPPPAKKKGQKQGRKDTLTEKPIVPPEPVEPILCGSMAIGAVSLAVAKTSAVLGNNPLYLNIALLKHHQDQPAKLTIPLLMVSLVSCGKSSPGKLNLMKEVICIPHPGLTAKQGVDMLLEIQKHINKTIEMSPPPKPETKKGHNGGKRGQQQITGKMSHLGCLTINYDTIEQPLLLIQGICANLGLEMGTNLHLAINCAAHELMDYDSEQWDSTYNALGSKCYIIAGTASKSISKLLEDGNIGILRCSGLIVKHTNQTTMSDLVEMTNLIDSKKHIAVFGSAEGESSDDSLVDLAVGLGVRFIKLGGLSRGERVTKYNRLFTIEEELVQNGTLGFSEEHTFFYLNEEAEKAAMAGELPEPPEPIFATEVVEQSAKT